jgi:hypothetical protein
MNQVTTSLTRVDQETAGPCAYRYAKNFCELFLLGYVYWSVCC